MKKIALILLALCVAGGTVMAEDDGLGLYVGAELLIGDLSEVSDTMGLRAYVGIDTSFDALDVYAEAGVDVPIGGNNFIGLDINGGVDYNIAIGDKSNLKVGAGLWVFFPFDDVKGMYTDVTPYGSYAGAGGTLSTKLNLHTNVGATFTQTMDFGDLYFGLDVPFILVADGASAFDIAELNFTAGLDMESGIGFGLTLYNWIGKGSSDFIQNLDIFGTYENGPLFLGLTVGVPLFKDGFKVAGLAITPEVAYTLDMGLKLYAEVPISYIGADKDVGQDMTIGLKVGAKFSF